MITLQERLEFIELIGDIFRFSVPEKNLSNNQKEAITRLTKKGLRNPLEMSGQEKRLALEEIYEYDKYCCCRLKAGLILNVFEQDLDDSLSGAGRPDWEELCSRINQSAEGLTKELVSKKYEKKSGVLENATQFYRAALSLQKNPYMRADLKIERLGTELAALSDYMGNFQDSREK